MNLTQVSRYGAIHSFALLIGVARADLARLFDITRPRIITWFPFPIWFSLSPRLSFSSFCLRGVSERFVAIPPAQTLLPETLNPQPENPKPYTLHPETLKP